MLVIILGLITIFMAYMAKDVTMSYSLFKAVPDDDPDAVFYQAFREQFGEDGNIVLWRCMTVVFMRLIILNVIKN